MAEKIAFTKMHGVGNDFVVVDGRDANDRDWSALAIEMCDRHTGIGADGLIILERTLFADLMMRMYNPDGTPDVCGNGLRCVARYAAEEGIVSKDILFIGTLAGVRRAELHRDAEGQIASITVSMGLPQFEPASIPMHVAQEPVIDFPLDVTPTETLLITALSTGTTHAVTFVSELPDDERFFTISPLVEKHPLFPERTSLMWCVLDAPNVLSMRIWERGAGETWGCGTGACAAAVAAVLKNCASPDAPITVRSKGGELIVRWRPGGEIEMTGPAERVYRGWYPLCR